MLKQIRSFLLVVLISGLSGSLSALSLEVVPDTFDFGWCPDNAKISAEFNLKNNSQSLIPIIDVAPSCGCTATDFSPEDLSAMEEMKVGLTFDTRGFKGRPFNKKSIVKTDFNDESYQVWLKGHVLNPNAKVVPEGNGIISFEKSDSKNKKTVYIKNNSNSEVTINIVRKPADWADCKLTKQTIKPGKKIPLSVSVKPPYDKAQHSSVTLEAIEKTTVHRLTLAIRTGPVASSRPRFQAPQ